MKYALGDVRVETAGEDYWIAPNATVIGRVKLEKDASIWWNAVLRTVRSHRLHRLLHHHSPRIPWPATTTSCRRSATPPSCA